MTQAKKEGGMIFRELEAFNVVLLSKMASRMWLEPDTLWVKVLKGLYFPSSEFSQAMKDSRSSWAWASVLERRRVLLEGSVWSVGDGSRIKPFFDAWVPGRYNKRLGIQPVTHAQANTMLEEWIDPVTRTWMESQIREVVPEIEVPLVLSVPIPLIRRPDLLRWPFERGGKLTVQSAYHHIQNQDGGSEDRTVSRGTGQPTCPTFGRQSGKRELCLRFEFLLGRYCRIL